MGVPTIAVTLAENQRPIAVSLEAAGAAIDAGWNRELTQARLADTLARLVPDETRRGEMSRRGRALVDGRGAQRVADALEDSIPATESN
jgi:UDP-2,4-diacetamido-2,4,6-trideoxy-beta-L-altropyranose hydrolase